MEALKLEALHNLLRKLRVQAYSRNGRPIAFEKLAASLESWHDDRTKSYGVKCEKCNEVTWSRRGGDFQACPCGHTYVDRDRWNSERIRVGGTMNAEVLTKYE